MNEREAHEAAAKLCIFDQAEIKAAVLNASTSAGKWVTFNDIHSWFLRMDAQGDFEMMED